MSQNWLHISPTSGTGSAQMTISADTNTTGVVRKAKIVITAGTMTRTIDVVQQPSEEYVVCTYVINSTAETLMTNNWYLSKAVITTSAGTVMEISGDSSLLTSSQDWPSLLGINVGEEIKVVYIPTDGYMGSLWFDGVPVKTIALYDKVIGITGDTNSNAPVFKELPYLESLYISSSVSNFPTGNKWNWDVA